VGLDRLPDTIEQEVSRFAAERHLSHDEAVVRLIENGLAASSVAKPSRIPGLPDEPLSEEEAKIVDEALEIVMETRGLHSERLLAE